MGISEHLPTVPLQGLRQLSRIARSLRHLLSGRESTFSRVRRLASLALNRGLNLGTIHAVQAIRQPNRLALVDERNAWTFEDANEEINRIGRLLRDRLEVPPGSPVMIMMENRAEYVMLWFALLRAGYAAVHTNYHYTPEELGYQMDHSSASVIFASERVLDTVHAARADRPDPPKVVSVDGADGTDATFSYRRLLEEVPPAFPGDGSDDEEVRNIVYTSGTTGRPKGTVRDMSANDRAREMYALLEALNMDQSDRHLVVAPFYHSGAQLFTILQSIAGCSVYVRSEFEAEDTLESLSRWNINSIFMVPTMIRRVLNLPDASFEDHPVEGLNCLVSTAAPFPQSLRERAIERFGAGTVHDSYGATELGTITHIDGHEMLEKPHSVGRPLPGHEIRILDEDGRKLPPGEVGTIYVRNDFTIRGYLNDEEATGEIRRGEWMTVDDLGYLDEDGYLYLEGRSRDLVITGGVNVYPIEVEEILNAHETVLEAAVFGVPDEQWGERLVAVIVPSGDEAFDPERLEAHCRERLTGAKVPKQWERADSLPRTRTGKILKRTLQEEYGD